jgi:hypothetical protein
MDIGLDDLELCTVPMKWIFNKNMEYMVSPETKALVCGSSSTALDDNGVACIIEAEGPVQVQRNDMSYYIDEVTVTVETPGEPIVVITSNLAPYVRNTV